MDMSSMAVIEQAIDHVGHINEDGTRTDDDQGRQSGVGGTLPNTATNSYTILLVGGVLLQDYVIIDKYACSK